MARECNDMPKYKVTIEVATDLARHEVESLFADVGYPAVVASHIQVSPISKGMSRAERIQEYIQQQEAWIQQCGGDLAGYIANYGSKNDPNHSGDGGEAIYAADVAQLTRLRAAV